MSEISPYGTSPHQGPNGMQTANALVGTPVGGQLANSAIPTSSPALMSTAPYKGRTKAEREKIEARQLKERVAAQHTDKMCAAPSKRFPGELCTAFHLKTSKYCRVHALHLEGSSEPAGDA